MLCLAGSPPPRLSSAQPASSLLPLAERWSCRSQTSLPRTWCWCHRASMLWRATRRPWAATISLPNVSGFVDCPRAQPAAAVPPSRSLCFQPPFQRRHKETLLFASSQEHGSAGSPREQGTQWDSVGREAAGSPRAAALQSRALRACLPQPWGPAAASDQAKRRECPCQHSSAHSLTATTAQASLLVLTQPRGQHHCFHQTEVSPRLQEVKASTQSCRDTSRRCSGLLTASL